MTEDPAKKIVLVLVEDEHTIAKLLCQMLGHAGFTVILASDGEQALVEIGAHLPSVIILDLALPKLSGWEVAERLKADPRTSGIPIVVYSTLSQKKDLERSAALGVVRHIGKDQGPFEVLNAVKEIVRIP